VLGASVASPPVPPALRDFVVLLSLTARSSHDITGTPFTDLLAIRVARLGQWLSFGVVVVIRGLYVIIIIFINCKWVDTRWQWSFHILHMHGL
jgi:hypothetical protein